MSVLFDNNSGQKIKLDGEQTFEEMSALLAQLVKPGGTLITQLPSGLGLDFHMEETGMLWIEFYAKDLSSAFVTPATAQQILQRAFEVETTGIKEKYADLIPKWEY